MHPEQIGPVFSRTTPRLLAVVFTVLVLLFVATGFLTGSYRRERHIRAQWQYQAGQKLAVRGDYAGAIDQYTEALTLSRDNPVYRQALALALVKAGRTKEAEVYLRELLRADPANAIANLTLARIYAKRGDLEGATGYYQRAIFGRWPADPREHRTSTEFELINLLEQYGKYTRMEAELLRLASEAPDDPALKKHIGHLFLTARSPGNAVKMFADAVRLSPRDGEAYAGLGDAEFELGHYFSARTAYHLALRYRPQDAHTRSQLKLATEIIDLDPMRRGLGPVNRLGRSQKLVRRALAVLQYCLPENRETLPADFRQTVERAEKLVSPKTRQRPSPDAVEANITLAEQLEDLRKSNCGAPPVPDKALELVLRKLAD